MITSRPSPLRLRLLSVRPRLLLSEVQLVDDTLQYRSIDGRDHVATEVRAVRPSAADWAKLRRVLDEVRFWSWPRRWPRAHDNFEGDFVIAVKWDGRVITSAGALGVAPEVDAVLDEVQQLASDARMRSLEPVPTLLSPVRPSPYRPDASDFPDRALALLGFPDSGTSAGRITPR